MNICPRKLIHSYGSGMGDKNNIRDTCGDETVLYCDQCEYLVVILCFSFARCCHWGKWVNSMQDLCVISYNCMWIYNFLIIKSLIKNITKLIHKWSSITYNSSKTEATGSFNGWVDKPVTVYPTHGSPFSATKGNKIIYATTWVSLKYTVLKWNK